MCPWCIIGYRRLEKAIEELGIADQVEIQWQPFELNPQMSPEGEDVVEHISRKYGSTREEGIESRKQMTALGEELGFSFDFFEGMRMVNTRNVHILLGYAKEFGKQTELKIRLFEAFFSHRKDISDRAVLSVELQHLGLDAEDALLRLDREQSRVEIELEEEHWKSLGISSVPTVVFNRSSALTGAQPVDMYKRVLSELLGG